MAHKSRVESPETKALIKQAVRQWQQVEQSETDQRKESKTDLDFLNLDQWPTNVLALRNQNGRERPSLTLDQISQPWRELVSQQQRANKSIRVVPESGDANKETADITQGIIRSIEYQSDAKTAYGICYSGAVGPGIGYIRMRAEYESPVTFDQRIVIEGIENPFSVYLDNSAKMPDRSDARFCLITEDVPAEEYNRRYPKSIAATLDRDKAGRLRPGPKGTYRTSASLSNLTGIGDEQKNWFPDGSVRIAEYYCVDDEEFDLIELSNGTIVDSRDLEDGQLDELLKPVEGQEPLEVVHRRLARVPVVKWALINGIEILEGGEPGKDGTISEGRVIPGTSIPIRPCYGETLNVNGVRIYRGIVRSARDAQRMYNYQNSALVEELALAPKSPIIGAEGQFEGHEEQWNQANTRAFPYLEYNPVSLGGTLAPPPGKPPGPDPAMIQAITVAINQAKNDIRTGTSYYDTTDPSRANSDQSGKAIQARKLQQEQTGLAFQENFRKLLVSLGKLLLEWIPAIYDRESRIVQVLGLEEGAEPEWAMIKSPFIRGTEGQPQKVGPGLNNPNVPAITYDPSKGIYGIRVTIGASHETRRQEAADALGRLIEAQPDFMRVFGDIYIRNLDIPDANEIADRVMRTIPPNILADDDDESLKQLPPAAQQRIAAAQMQVQELQQQLQAATEMLEQDKAKTEGTAIIEQMRQHGESMRTQLKSEQAITIANMKQQVDIFRAQIEAAKVQATIAAQEASKELAESQQGLEGMTTLATSTAPTSSAP